MTLKFTLFFLAIAVAANAFAAPQMHPRYSGTMVDTVSGSQPLGQGSLTERARSQDDYGQEMDVVLSAQIDSKSQGVLVGTEFATLTLDLSNAQDIGDGHAGQHISKIPTTLLLQIDTSEHEETLMRTYSGTCVKEESMTTQSLECSFQVGTQQSNENILVHLK